MPRKPNISGDHYNDPFPTRLRELMESRGTRQEDLTDVLGVKSRQSVTGYTDGGTVPTSDKLIALAKYFNVSVDYLIGLTDVAKPDTELQAVCDYIGLSEKAVEELHREAQRMKLRQQNGNTTRLEEEWLQSVDLMIKNHPGLFALINDYLCNNYHCFTSPLPNHEQSKPYQFVNILGEDIEKNAKETMLFPEEVQELVLMRIENYLRISRREVQTGKIETLKPM